MAGASTAAPIDAAGALHWNPATLTGLPSSEFVVSAELLNVTSDLSSTVPGLSGSTQADSGVFVLPTVALAFQSEESSCAYGLGLYSIGGFGFNYPADPTNPVLAANALYSRLSIMQIAPTAAVQLTDKISIGFAPTISMVDAAMDPSALSPMVGGAYPPATHGRIFWGMGFQAGIYYVTDSCWTFGASYKSPQWFEKFEFNSPTVPTKVVIDADYPAIISLGTADHGIDRLVWALDFRFIDYQNTDGFGDATGFAPLPDLNFTGLGWDSVWSVATGLQYDVNDRLTIRLGYSFNENPIQDRDTSFNVVSPAIYQHVFSVGSSLCLSDRTKLSMAYLHALENSIAGPLQHPTLGVIGAVKSDVYVDALIAGLEVRF